MELDQAIGRALEFVEDRVRLPYRSFRSPPATRLDPSAAQAWHRELERLRDVRESVRFAALDDPHHGTPAVQVATRAATAPDVPGLRTGDHDLPPPPGNGMGIDLDAVIDTVSERSRSLRPPVSDVLPGLRGAASGQPGTPAPSMAA